MISFELALALIDDNVVTARSVKMPVVDAWGKTVAQEIRAPINLPPFDNSAVDGYAVNCLDIGDGRLPIGAITRAQAQEPTTLSPRQCAKIMTGAPMPSGADAVVMREDVIEIDGVAHCKKIVAPGDNVRLRGEDVAQNNVVIEKGCVLTPQHLGLLAALGITDVDVFNPLSVAIISTGDELVQPGSPLNYGQVYYLMGPMLKAQCASAGITDVHYTIVPDDRDAIIDAINNAHSADMVLLTGGMSKGDYDHVREALSVSAVEEIFYQGYWRPGKPLYFGRRSEQIIFGLPGNPVAAFVCFNVFVQQAIFKSMQKNYARTLPRARVRKDFSKKLGFTFFARAIVDEDNTLVFVSGQGSHQIFSLSKANALCLLPTDTAIVKAGEVVQYYPC